MQFVYPFFLWASAVVIIPIIIHLFNFRRYKTVYFSSIYFLQEIKSQTKKQSTLKHLLVLLARVLALLFLVFAFAQPFIPATYQALPSDDGRQYVSIYIDNSFSMQNMGEEGQLLDMAKKKGEEIVQAYGVNDRFQLITNQVKGSQQRFMNRDEFLVQLEQIEYTATSTLLTTIIDKQKSCFDAAHIKRKTLYLLSDFQKSTHTISSLKEDTLTQINYVHLVGNESHNIYVDSCWVDQGLVKTGQVLTMYARIFNRSNEDMDKIVVKLVVNGKQKALSSLSVLANQYADVSLSYTLTEGGIQQGVIQLVDHPIVYDDNFYFTFSVSDKSKVLVVNETQESPYLNAVFAKDSSILMTNQSVKQLDYATFNRYQTIILHHVKNYSSGLQSVLQGFVKQGGMVVIFPPEEDGMVSVNEWLSKLAIPTFTWLDTQRVRLDKISEKHRLYRQVFDKTPDDVEKPMVYKYYQQSKGLTAVKEDILLLSNGQPFLTAYPFEQGMVYLFASPLLSTYTSWQTYSLFVPTLYNMVALHQLNALRYASVDATAPIVFKDSLRKGEAVYRLVAQDKGMECIPFVKKSDNQLFLYLHHQLSTAGFYQVVNKEQVCDVIAINYNRKESDMRCFTPDELTDYMNEGGRQGVVYTNKANLSQDIQAKFYGKGYWKQCVLLVLLFLLIEIGLIKFF